MQTSQQLPCRTCGEPVPQKEGRRRKDYCDDRCKQRYHQELRRKYKKSDLLADFLQFAIDKKLLANRAGGVDFVTKTDTCKKVAKEYLARVEKLRKNILPANAEKPLAGQEVQTNNELAEQRTRKIPPMPERMEGEGAIDYANRKGVWKQKYGHLIG